MQTSRGVGLPWYAVCVSPQVENGGDMVHVRDFTSEAVRFGMLFDQVPPAGLSKGGTTLLGLVKDRRGVTSYLGWEALAKGKL